MKENQYSFIVNRIVAPQIKYNESDEYLKEKTVEPVVSYTAKVGNDRKSGNNLLYTCQLEADIRVGKIHSIIVANGEIGVKDTVEISKAEREKILPQLLTPLMAKIAEIFAFLSGSNNPFPVILPGELGPVVISHDE